MTAPTPPPEPSIAELQARHPVLQEVQLWRGCYSAALYAIVPGAGHLAWADEGHTAAFAQHLADGLTARQPLPPGS